MLQDHHVMLNRRKGKSREHFILDLLDRRKNKCSLHSGENQPWVLGRYGQIRVVEEKSCYLFLFNDAKPVKPFCL